MTLQTKLKFNVDPQQLPRLRSLALIRRISKERATTQKLSTTYFDTPRGDLRNMGISLRLRRIGSNTMQTVKASAEPVGNARTDYVFEAPVSTERPIPSIILPPTLRNRVQEVGPAKLKPLVRVDAKRSSRRVMIDGDTLALLEIEEGEIHVGERPITIADLEISTSSDQLHLLYDLARQIQDKITLFPVLESESDIGYRHMGLSPASATDGTRLKLGKRQSQEKAFIAIVQACFERLQFTANWLHNDWGSEVGTEDLASLNRLRTAIRVFRSLVPEQIGREMLAVLDGIVDIFGPWQNWATVEDQMIAPMAKAPGGSAELGPIADAVNESRGAARRAACDALVSAQFSHLLLDLGHMLAKRPWREISEFPKGAGPGDPVKSLAAKVLGEHSLKIRNRAKHWAKNGEPETKHLVDELRAFHHAVALFGGLYPTKRVKAIAAALNKIEAGRRYLDALDFSVSAFGDPTYEPTADRATALSAGFVLGWHGRARNVAERRLKRNIKALLEQKPPWKRGPSKK